METYHFIGIGGIGMSALARILLQQGKKVVGSDKSLSTITNELALSGAQIYQGHHFDNVQNVSTVVFSTDIKNNNPELTAAKEMGCNLLHRSELLAQLMVNYKPLLVTGTHGKTTTSSLLSHTLLQIGWDPTFAIGGILKNYQANSKCGAGEYFVAEADESDGSFLSYPAYCAIITNLDLDHLNFWQTEEQLVEGFKKFADKISDNNKLFFCKDDDRLKKCQINGTTYGFDPSSDIHLHDFIQDGLYVQFSITWNKRSFEKIKTPLIGRHNALNAAAVFALMISLGANEADVRKAFISFEGVKRRADKIGEINNISIYDDYGHHPTEIKATLKAFKNAYKDKRIICLFQPHRYTRTRDCLQEFADCFLDADVVVLTDIYAAQETPIEGINTMAVLSEVSSKKMKDVYYVRKDKLFIFLASYLKETDVIITMGAGDITKFGPDLLEFLSSSG